MSKQVKFLVTEIDGEREVLTEEALTLCGLDEETVKSVYGNSAYWIRLTLREATWGDQQAALRESNGDSSLIAQKRFVRAVESWEKQYADSDSKSLLEVTESAILEIKPPGLGNVIQDAIIAAWYPVASKSLDFFQRSKQKQADSEKDKSLS